MIIIQAGDMTVRAPYEDSVSRVQAAIAATFGISKFDQEIVSAS